MKILFTAEGKTWSSPVDPRLGRADFLVVFDEESGDMTAVSNEESRTMEPCQPTGSSVH